MSVYGGLGPMTNGVLWAEVFIVVVFVGLRLYTRRVILNAVGIDDALAVASLVRRPPQRHVTDAMTDMPQLIQILYNIFVSIASVYGLGRKYEAVGNPVIYFTAVKYELFSQVAGIMAIGVGKLAVGAFLLRIVRSKIQIWFIRACIVITIIITLFASITVVVQCTPVQRSWNPTVPGTCWLDFSKVGYTVGCECYLYTVTPPKLGPEMLKLDLSSVVRRRRLLLCHPPVVHYLEPQHEAEGEDHRCLWSQPWRIVSRNHPTLTSNSTDGCTPALESVVSSAPWLCPA